ncbi:hypothetical protein CTI12_AA209650 [Artemisia annua]|uniref:PB1-like domain-containing protein n=1 Tax=Artemisia annua TaxID=35608 RepID=A0A2U1NZZ6_ARTAN|nr:hypothetical protein CTI12_AA209650 [Artemisia annua]
MDIVLIVTYTTLGVLVLSKLIAIFCWKDYYFIYDHRLLFVLGFVFSRSLAYYAIVDNIMWYLTDNDGGFVRSAVLSNILESLSSLLVIVMAHSADSFVGRFRTLLLSTTAYIGGIMLLWMFDPYDITWLVVILIVLLALGKSGDPILKCIVTDLVDDIDKSGDRNRKRSHARAAVWWRISHASGAISATLWVTPLALGGVNPTWKTSFFICLIVMTTTLIIFCGGHEIYHQGKLIERPIEIFLRVLHVRIHKLLHSNSGSRNPTRMHETEVITVEQTSRHSDTDKKKNRVSSSYKRDVKVVRSLLRMFPMWGTFFVVSLISAVGNTFYIEQYSNLENKLDIPIQIFELIQDFSGFMIPFVYHWTCFFQNQKFKIGVGMFCSIISCMFAWRLEVHRLQELTMLGGDENAETSLSFLWLVPQFFMLGCMEGLTENGLLNFFKSQIDEPMKNYGDEYIEVVICLGELINIVLILILRQFGWFGEDVNSSTRLDKYYLLLVLECLYILICLLKKNIWNSCECFFNLRISFMLKYYLGPIPLSYRTFNERLNENLVRTSIKLNASLANTQGTFSYDPLEYVNGSVDIVENVDLGKCNQSRLMRIVKECCLFPVHGMYFCAPKQDLQTHLKPLRNDSELAIFVKLAFDNGCKVELYVEHYGYDILEDAQIDAIVSEEDEESDSEIELENIKEYVGPEHTELRDPFLIKLVGGRYIRDDDVSKPANLGEGSASASRENEDEQIEVDDRFKVKEGYSYPVFDPNVPWDQMIPLLGMKFEHPDQLKECLINYGVKHGYQLWFKRNDYRNVAVLCGRNVEEGRLWAGWMQNEATFQIKTLIPNHTCSRNYDLGSLVTYKWLAKQFAHEVVRNPKISYRQMKADTKEKYKINVSVGMCKRAKQRAVYDHEGGLIDHYAKLWDYREQILITNPGSSVHLDVDTRDDGKTMFNRMYVCFKDPHEADPTHPDPHEADPTDPKPNEADEYDEIPISSSYPSASQPSFSESQSFTGLLQRVGKQRNDSDITDAEITQLAELNEAEDRARRAANRKYNQRIIEDAKKAGLYRKRGADGFRGPSERIRNQKRKLDPNAPGHHPDTALDIAKGITYCHCHWVITHT